MTVRPPVWVIGLSTWDRAVTTLTPAARQALAEARTVAGGRWHRDAVADVLAPDVRWVPLAGGLDALDEIAATDAAAVVLASGDPGFFGVLRGLRARLGRDDAAERLRVVPAVSSVASVFAHAGLPWDDAVVASAHGRDPSPAIAVARRFDKVAVLTSPEFGPGELAAALDDRPRRWLVGERLGTDDARVHAAWPRLASREWADPNVVALVATDEAHGDTVATTTPPVHAPRRTTPTRWALDEDAFAHRDAQLTKSEVRAVALAWLAPGVGDLVWDLGCGSGSVAVECARLGAAAIAVDRDAEQCAYARANAESHGVPLDVRHGAAPALLADLPDPDAVFVGGGGGDVAAILAVAAARARRVVVVALAALERVEPAWNALADAGLTMTGTQLAANRLRALPDGSHRLAATNPVTLVRGEAERVREVAR